MCFSTTNRGLISNTARLQQEITGFHICSRYDASFLCSLAFLISRDVLFGLMIHSLGQGYLVTPKRLIPYLQSFVVGNTENYCCARHL